MRTWASSSTSVLSLTEIRALPLVPDPALEEEAASGAAELIATIAARCLRATRGAEAPTALPRSFCPWTACLASAAGVAAGFSRFAAEPLAAPLQAIRVLTEAAAEAIVLACVA